jgi:hypothetical protein
MIQWSPDDFYTLCYHTKTDEPEEESDPESLRPSRVIGVPTGIEYIR